MKPCVLGTTYYHFAHPSEDYAAEFVKMRDMGLDSVRVAEIWPGWEVLEPRNGEYDFADLDYFVQQAHKAGLKVIMGVGINNPPFWVFREIPDLRCRDVSGKVSARRVQSANHDNTEYRKLMERFIVTHVQHYANMQGISAWQFGNEMRYGANIVDNEATRVRFRGWLREKFNDDLDELNRQWATFYESWDDMYPYSSPAGPPTAGLPPLALASREYQCWSVEELNEWGTNLIRQHSDLPVFHNNFGYSAPHGSHWRMARPGDWVVQDIYPATSPNPQIYASFLLDCGVSIARSLDKPHMQALNAAGHTHPDYRRRIDRGRCRRVYSVRVEYGADERLDGEDMPVCRQAPGPRTGTGSSIAGVCENGGTGVAGAGAAGRERRGGCLRARERPPQIAKKKRLEDGL